MCCISPSLLRSQRENIKIQASFVYLMMMMMMIVIIIIIKLSIQYFTIVAESGNLQQQYSVVII
jgi:hypothetical protein